MATITFIVGNGLDLSLGLKTAYRDFYEYVKTNKLHPENRIYKAIEESPETWADFEQALGRYTDYIDELPDKDKKKGSIKFHDELEDIREDLAIYIQNQEKEVKDKSTNTTITHDGFYAELAPGQRARIASGLGNIPHAFKFVTLNYTKTLKAILGNSRVFLRNRGVNLGEPHHIHGDLFENMTLGVSDESQLSKSMYGEEKDDLIKPVLIYSMNDGRIDALNSMLESSHFIVIYGTSVGETDKYIWQSVTNWLSRNPSRHLIIHKHDNTYTDSVKRSSRKQKQYISSVQERILRFSAKDGDAISELKTRIFVVHNSKKLLIANK